MVTGTMRWRDLEPFARAERARAAASRLDAGGLVTVPTETVYGLAVSAASEGGVRRWRAALGDVDAPATWHAASVAAVASALDLPTAVHRRLTSRLLPGPVRFVLEQREASIASWLVSVGVPRGLLDAGGRVAVRVPSHDAARAVLRLAAAPVVMAGVGRSPADAPEADEVIDDGRSPGGSPATVVRLALSGAFEVEPLGEVSPEDVMSALTRTVLFVCTGNTCRSPMAAAIAQAEAASRPPSGVTTRVRSAGLSAGRGAPATAEAVEALRRRGLDLRAHHAALFTRELGRQAEAIYTMTAAHAEAVLALDPSLAGRVETLDPSGDIPDPIGGPLSLYEATADRLAMLVRRRLDELDAASTPASEEAS